MYIITGWCCCCGCLYNDVGIARVMALLTRDDDVDDDDDDDEDDDFLMK